VEVERIETQYQEDNVRQTVGRRFEIEVGRGQCCQAQGRHQLQTSDALGAA